MLFISTKIKHQKKLSIIKPDIYFKGPDYKNNQNDKTKNIYKVALTKNLGEKLFIQMILPSVQ